MLFLLLLLTLKADETVQVHTYKQILPNIDYSLLFVHKQGNVFNYTIVSLTLLVPSLDAGGGGGQMCILSALTCIRAFQLKTAI